MPSHWVSDCWRRWFRANRSSTRSRRARLDVTPLEQRTVPACLGTIVPAYFYPEPGGYWDQMTAEAGRVPIIAILNPDSGPGAIQDPNYVRAVNQFREAGGGVIGYVSTRYGARPVREVQADISRYAEWYSIDGIFLDEMSNTPQGAAYYQGLYELVHEVDPAWLVVGNPGTNTVEEYLAQSAADILVTFESRRGYESYEPRPWMYQYAAWQFGHLPYNVPDVPTMESYVDLAVARNVGWVYVTNDDTDPDENPWDTLPTYWTQFIDKLTACGQPGGGHSPSRPPLLDAAVAAALTAKRSEGASVGPPV